MKASYEVLTVMQSWTQRGPTPDKLLSKHKSYDADLLPALEAAYDATMPDWPSLVEIG